MKWSLMPREVRPRRCPQPVQAGRREDGLGAAGVRRAQVALDGAVGDEPVDQPGHAAPAQQDPVRELVHPQPPAGRLGELEQRVVLGERQVVLRPEILVEAAARAGRGR